MSDLDERCSSSQRFSEVSFLQKDHAEWCFNTLNCLHSSSALPGSTSTPLAAAGIPSQHSQLIVMQGIHEENVQDKEQSHRLGQE